MGSMSWFVPLLPGKLDAWKAMTEESNGPRREEHARSRQRLGITREVAALVQTPQGDFTSVFLEAEDIATVFKSMFESDDPYDKWFMDRTMEVHGMNPEMFEAGLPAKVYFDYRADAMAGQSERRREKSAGADTD